MDILDGLYQNFLRFFSGEEIAYLATPTGLLVMVNLVLSEGLLSLDNALVLAVMVSHLPKDRYYRLGPVHMSVQQWALTAGLLGAYFFRVLAIGIGTYLIQFWFLQLLGGGYLLWLAHGHFTGIGKKDSEARVGGRGFWSTVVKVELMDIAFSIDSILAALGISHKVWIILMGGVLGILCMRLVAGVFVRLLERFPLFRHTGHALIAFIGYRLVSEVDWSHLEAGIQPLGLEGLGVSALGVVTVWGVAHLVRPRLDFLKALIHLAAAVALFSWSSTHFHLHMSDLAFSLVMIGTFAATFLLNGVYLRFRRSAHE